MNFSDFIAKKIEEERNSWPWYIKLMDWFFPEFIVLDFEKVNKEWLLLTEPKFVRAFDFNTMTEKMVQNPLLERLTNDR